MNIKTKYITPSILFIGVIINSGSLSDKIIQSSSFLFWYTLFFFSLWFILFVSFISGNIKITPQNKILKFTDISPDFFNDIQNIFKFIKRRLITLSYGLVSFYFLSNSQPNSDEFTIFFVAIALFIYYELTFTKPNKKDI